MTTHSLPMLWTAGMRELCNHLWQSTLFAGVVWLLTLSLRKYQARTRYWLWMAASIKFLIPVSLLAVIVGHFKWITHANESQNATLLAMHQMGQPFTEVTGLSTPIISMATPLPASHYAITPLVLLLTAVWLLGFITVLTFWFVQWYRFSKYVHRATSLGGGREVEALRRMERIAGLRSPMEIIPSPDSMEPGVFGIVRPVLLWPEGISRHLDDAHLEAVLAHEVCHVRWRDNLTSMIHMLVSAIFWFHPLVWWMEKRLVKERELGCDEEVVNLCKQPQVYAESILKVCEFCIESPLPCVSGITGADLKKRVMQIMTGRIGLKLSPGRKLLLIAVALTAVAVPVAFGLYVQSAAVPAWQVAAGGKMEFEIASVRENIGDPGPTNPMESNFPLGSTPVYSHNGGLMSLKNIDLPTIIDFAYRLTGMQGNYMVRPQLPEWAQRARFNIEARAAEGTEPTKDQMRLMVQSLLAERFKMAAHMETRQEKIYALRMVEPGKLGTQIKLHPADASCPTTRSNDMPRTGHTPLAADGLPQECGYMRGFRDDPKAEKLKYTGRGTPIAEIAKLMTVWKDDGVAVLDETGLDGKYDLTLEFTPSNENNLPPEQVSDFGAFGPDLEKSLRKQLGMKLDSTKGPVETLVIDHLERPSPN